MRRCARPTRTCATNTLRPEGYTRTPKPGVAPHQMKYRSACGFAASTARLVRAAGMLGLDPYDSVWEAYGKQANGNRRKRAATYRRLDQAISLILLHSSNARKRT